MTHPQRTARAPSQLPSLLAELSIRRRLAELADPEAPADALLAGLLLSFLRRAPVALTDLSGALECGDSQRWEQLAHGLKGVALNLGVDELGAACEEMEACGRTGRLADAPPTLQRAEQAWEAAAPVLRRLADELA